MPYNHKNPQIIDSTDWLDLEVDRNMKVTKADVMAHQEIPDEFLRGLRAERDHQDSKFAADDIKVASIPVAVVDHWFREGFNIWDKNTTVREIVARLQKEDLTAFLTTSKSI